MGMENWSHVVTLFAGIAFHLEHFRTPFPAECRWLWECETGRCGIKRADVNLHHQAQSLGCHQIVCVYSTFSITHQKQVTLLKPSFLSQYKKWDACSQNLDRTKQMPSVLLNQIPSSCNIAKQIIWRSFWKCKAQMTISYQKAYPLHSLIVRS